MYLHLTGRARQVSTMLPNPHPHNLILGIKYIFKDVQCLNASRHKWTHMDVWKIPVCHSGMLYVFGFGKNMVDIQGLSSLTQDATLQQLAYTWPVKMNGVILISLWRRSGSHLELRTAEGIILEEEADFK